MLNIGSKASRRDVLRAGAMVVAGGAFVASELGLVAASAQAGKAPQTTARYQISPNGPARCETCALFLAPNACKLVDGPINPNGWCLLYAPQG